MYYIRGNTISKQMFYYKTCYPFRTRYSARSLTLSFSTESRALISRVCVRVGVLFIVAGVRANITDNKSASSAIASSHRFDSVAFLIPMYTIFFLFVGRIMFGPLSLIQILALYCARHETRTNHHHKPLPSHRDHNGSRRMSIENDWMDEYVLYF